MGFADFDIMGKCKTIIEKVEGVATNLSEAKTSADNAKTSADTAASAIGATGNTGGSATAGTVMGKLNKLITDLTTHMGRWTNTRAGYIDNIRSYTVTNNTASKTGVLSSKLAYVISLLENTTYGLSALKTASSSSVVKNVQRGTIIIQNKALTGTATISSVNTSKAIVLFSGNNINYDNDSIAAAHYLIALTLESATSVKAERSSYFSGETITVPYQVIEFY